MIESTLTIGDLTLTGNRGCPDDLVVSSVGSWFDTVELTDDLRARAMAGLPLGQLPPKPYSITGWLDGDQGWLRGIQADLAALPFRGLVPVTYSEAGAWSSRLSVVVRPESELDHAGGRLRFALDLLAADPRRYGAWTWSAAITATTYKVYNRGTAPSPLWLTLQRNGATQTIATPGTTATFSRPLADGTGLELRAETLDVYLSAKRAGGLVATQWPVIPPRSSVTVTVTGASSWRVASRDAWW